MVEASFTGTVRVITILILVWFILRLLRKSPGRKGAGRGFNVGSFPQRPKGDVRIEKVKGAVKEEEKDVDLPITDADYEELK